MKTAVMGMFKVQGSTLNIERRTLNSSLPSSPTREAV